MESAVVDEADIVHHQAVGHHGFIGATAEQVDVIKEKKISGQPADGVRQGIVPE